MKEPQKLIQKFYIPEIGDKIVLEQDWEFELQHERRNIGIAKVLGYEVAAYHYRQVGGWITKGLPDMPIQSLEITLEKGTILSIDRIYVKKGAMKYSSISFIVYNNKFQGKRFWANLDFVNKIYFSPYAMAKNIMMKWKQINNNRYNCNYQDDCGGHYWSTEEKIKTKEKIEIIGSLGDQQLFRVSYERTFRVMELVELSRWEQDYIANRGRNNLLNHYYKATKREFHLYNLKDNKFMDTYKSFSTLKKHVTKSLTEIEVIRVQDEVLI